MAEGVRVEVKGQDPSCMTFVIHNEGHTLGNVLRYFVSKHEDVELCGYSIHHPSDEKLHLRVQLVKNESKKECRDVLKDSLENISGMCDHLEKLFVDACDRKSKGKSEGKSK
mmetsp:Transcript_9984/g.14978  ORF Transcript_9984/g.14978 Transcript_9984/m.14978 type:complete len:112 (+) Transcript_9984:37-372(+)